MTLDQNSCHIRIGGLRLISLLFGILMLVILGKLLVFAIKASWGLVKILFTIVFLPLILLGLIVAGLAAVAIPAILILGVLAFVSSRTLK